MKKVWILSLILTGWVAAAMADEGMFLPNRLDKLDWKKLKKMGLNLKADDVMNADSKKGLNHAIIRLNIGGTGEFVSEKGLILTNHHVAFGAIRENSTETLNLLEEGFHAATLADELKTTYTGQVTERMDDVTAAVLAALDTARSFSSVSLAKKAIFESLSKSHTAFPERSAEVMSMNEGNEYTLVVYRFFNDIRLVNAPPRSIGEYGGETDNWMWPRHTGDFSFLRAYMSADGKTSAAYSKENVPYVPGRFLKISAKGLKDNDFTFIMGYPGRTTRYRTSFETAFALDHTYPVTISLLDASIKGMEEATKNNVELEIEYASNIKGFLNTIKNFQGNVAGLQKNGLIDEKRQSEKAFSEWVAKDNARKEKYGAILSDIESLYKEMSSMYTKPTIARWPMRSRWFPIANGIDKSVTGKEVTPAEKTAIVAKYMGSAGSVRPELEKNVLRNVLTLYYSLPADQQSADMKGLLAAGKPVEEAVSTLAGDVIKSLPSADSASVTSFVDAVVKGGDAIPVSVRLARALNAETGTYMKFEQEFTGKIGDLRKKYLEALAGFRGEYLYPDANFTLRFTYGSVKGFEPRDAVIYKSQTVFKGVIDKESGEEPFKNHPKLISLYQNKDFGKWADSRLNDVPVAFLTTNDITGGNSGSPVINGNGELIGCAFDGVWEALTGDWKFEDSVNRTIAVDSRYVLFVLDKFSGAQNLLKEMVIVH